MATPRRRNWKPDHAYEWKATCPVCDTVHTEKDNHCPICGRELVARMEPTPTVNPKHRFKFICGHCEFTSDRLPCRKDGKPMAGHHIAGLLKCDNVIALWVCGVMFVIIPEVFIIGWWLTSGSDFGLLYRVILLFLIVPLSLGCLVPLWLALVKAVSAIFPSYEWRTGEKLEDL